MVTVLPLIYIFLMKNFIILITIFFSTFNYYFSNSIYSYLLVICILFIFLFDKKDFLLNFFKGYFNDLFDLEHNFFYINYYYSFILVSYKRFIFKKYEYFIWILNIISYILNFYVSILFVNKINLFFFIYNINNFFFLYNHNKNSLNNFVINLNSQSKILNNQSRSYTKYTKYEDVIDLKKRKYELLDYKNLTYTDLNWFIYNNFVELSLDYKNLDRTRFYEKWFLFNISFNSKSDDNFSDEIDTIYSEIGRQVLAGKSSSNGNPIQLDTNKVIYNGSKISNDALTFIITNVFKNSYIYEIDNDTYMGYKSAHDFWYDFFDAVKNTNEFKSFEEEVNWICLIDLNNKRSNFVDYCIGKKTIEEITIPIVNIYTNMSDDHESIRYNTYFQLMNDITSYIRQGSLEEKKSLILSDLKSFLMERDNLESINESVLLNEYELLLSKVKNGDHLFPGILDYNY